MWKIWEDFKTQSWFQTLIKEGHLTTKEGRADNGMNSTFLM